MRSIRLKVNSEEIDTMVKPNWTLLKVLRELLGLKGVKIGCDLASCGACTVLVDGLPIYSCQVLAVQLDGCAITTIEGLGKDITHPLQRAFISEGAVQCGYCIPGFIMTALALTKKNDAPEELEVKKALSGNICRCGAYPKILSAVLSVIRQSVTE